MTWQQLLKEGRVEAVPATKPDLDDLRAVVARCLKDSGLPLDPDNKFGLVYNAARTLALIAVAAAGYRVKHRGGGHYNTFLALRAAMGTGIEALADYLDDCRDKRNELSYEAAHVVTETEADELVMKTRELETLVDAWIARNGSAHFCWQGVFRGVFRRVGCTQPTIPKAARVFEQGGSSTTHPTPVA